MMRKELVVAIFAVLMVTLFTTNITQAVDPNLSLQPLLIQDQTMRPLDPPPESHPTANQYTAPLTNPANAYDNSQVTYSSTNISQQPYPSVYSRPTAYTKTATVTNEANAYDLVNSTYAQIAINNQAVEWPSYKEFNVTTFNTTAITTVSSIDVHIKHNLTLTVVGKIGYKFMLYVGTKSRILQDLTWTQIDVDTVIGNWTAVPEPNDGVWSKADVGNIRIGIQTGRNQTTDRGTFRVFEVWTRVYSPVIKYFDVRTFSPTGISEYSYLKVNINCSIVIGGCSYKILVSVGSANTTLQSWTDVPQIAPEVLAWERVTEPNDGWWNQMDLSNMRIIMETQIIKSENNGEFRVYEAWVAINPPTVNSYPSSHTGTATVSNPTFAYDKKQMTYASISPPGATTTTYYFAVQSFNATTLKDYATINIQMRYNVTTYNGRYGISLYVGAKSLYLQKQINTNQTEPIVRTWVGVCEPNDGVWSPSDIGNMQMRVEVRKTNATTGACTFREYDTWVTIPEDHFTVRAYVSGVQVSAPLYGWQFNFTFNPTVLQAVIVNEGPFLKLAGATQYAGYTISNTAGWVFSGCTVNDFFSGGVDGSGTVAAITFQVVAKGNSMLNFTATELISFDEVGEVPVPLAHTRSPGWFQYLAGDVNGDAKVDVYDLHQLGKAYGTTSGNPTYDAEADQDKDGDVDGTDLTTVSSHYGDT